MKFILNISTVILIFLITIIVIPNILGLLDPRLSGISFSKHYFDDILSVNKAVGIFGIVLFLGIGLIFVRFYVIASEWIEKRKH